MRYAFSNKLIAAPHPLWIIEFIIIALGLMITLKIITHRASPVPSFESNEDWRPFANRFVQEFDGFEMVKVPPGCFDMGSTTGEADEQPVNEVCFNAPFWIDRYEVTNGQFTALGGEATNDSCKSNADNYPRECITWIEAHHFCKLRGARLPTEAEWEYAARGPDGLAFPWGNVFNGNNVFYRGNSVSTAIVGSAQHGLSWVGAYDLSGNVLEWTSTIYAPYPYDANDGRENNLDGRARVLRGGSFFNSTSNLRATYRLSSTPRTRRFFTGFRCARPE